MQNDQKKGRQKAVIIMPTYNEAETVPLMIDHLTEKTFPAIKNWEMEILIVDSNSPDGTAELVQKIMGTHPNVHLLKEQVREGLGAAYVKGFKYSIEKLKADVIFEFDADFQHPPETIPVMLKKIEEGYDYVLGSRMIAGGSDSENRKILRRALTVYGALVARLLLFFPYSHFYKITDPTTGLKATRVKGFANRLNLDPDHLFSKKFGYKLQLLSETIYLGAKYTEIPLQFRRRLAGSSKFVLSTIFETLYACLMTAFTGIFHNSRKV